MQMFKVDVFGFKDEYVATVKTVEQAKEQYPEHSWVKLPMDVIFYELPWSDLFTPVDPRIIDWN